MKRLFYLLFGLVLLPALLYAQGSLSPKDINDNLTNNYYNKIASDARYATTASVALKADQTDMDSAEAAINALNISDDSQDVQIEANRVAITTKATQIDMDSAEAAINLLIIDLDSAEAALMNDIANLAANYWTAAATKAYADGTDENIINVLLPAKATTIDMDSAEAAIQLILADDDSQDVMIEANRVGVASLEVGLQTHQNNPTGAHAATAISATWTNVQVSLDSIEAAIQGIVVGSGFALESWVNATLENNFYTKAQTNATIEAAIAAIPAGGGTAIEDIGTYIESNTTWEFDADYDTTAVLIYRNRLYQPRSLFTTVDVASKTRVVFNSTINASDEIILISNK